MSAGSVVMSPHAVNVSTTLSSSAIIIFLCLMSLFFLLPQRLPVDRGAAGLDKLVVCPLERLTAKEAAVRGQWARMGAHQDWVRGSAIVNDFSDPYGAAQRHWFYAIEHGLPRGRCDVDSMVAPKDSYHGLFHCKASGDDVFCHAMPSNALVAAGGVFADGQSAVEKKHALAGPSHRARCSRASRRYRLPVL